MEQLYFGRPENFPWIHLSEDKASKNMYCVVQTTFNLKSLHDKQE